MIAGSCTQRFGPLWAMVATFVLIQSLPQPLLAQRPAVPPVASATREPKVADPSNESPVESPAESPLQDVPTWSQLARGILLTAIPDKYEDTKHWGKTKEVFDGLQVKQRGFDIRLSERRKKVNHGAWYKYSVQFPRLEQNLKVVIDQVHSPEPGRFTFAIHVAIRNIRVTGQIENWVLGVKGLNFDVVSDAEVHLHAVCDLVIKTQTRPKSLLPDLVLDPSIRSIRLDLADLETHRIGRVGGDIAEELGNGSRQFIKELMHSQEGRVLKKANEAIQKKRDSLRVPVSKLW